MWLSKWEEKEIQEVGFLQQKNLEGQKRAWDAYVWLKGGEKWRNAYRGTEGENAMRSEENPAEEKNKNDNREEEECILSA